MIRRFSFGTFNEVYHKGFWNVGIPQRNLFNFGCENFARVMDGEILSRPLCSLSTVLFSKKSHEYDL